VMFAAIYKVLPDRDLTWRDVAVGAAVTGLLFTIGKALIGLYLGSSSMASSYGAAGGLLIMLVWIYYSAQIFLVGAEFTKVYASNYGSLRGTEAARSVMRAAGQPAPDADPAAGRVPAKLAGISAPAKNRRGLAPAPSSLMTQVLTGFFLLRALTGVARSVRRS
jgi:hypothetical protein